MFNSYKQRLWIRFLLLSLALLVLNLVPAAPVHAATITVNSTADNLTASDGLCTLREAIRNANLAAGGDTTGGDCTAGSVGADTIVFDSSLDGTPITLGIAGAGEDVNATGDLDIRGDLTIAGNGVTNTIVDGGAIDRVFHVAVMAMATFTVNFDNLTIQNGNAGALFGGGVFIGNATHTVNINNSRLSGNTAAMGGGIFNSVGTLTIVASTIDDNFATGTGGGGVAGFGGVTTVSNSTISGNRTNGHGGGVFNQATAATLNLSYVTITNNIADLNLTGPGDGGGVRHVNATTTFTSTIIAGNDDLTGTANDDCVMGSGGTVTTFGYNLRPLTTGCAGRINNVTDINVVTLGLGPLQNNGGRTQTHLPQNGSDAIDRVPNGTNGCDTTIAQDQRGATRSTDGNADGTAACDVGAVELGGLQCGIQSSGEPTSYTFLGNVVLEVDDDGTNLDCIRVTDIPISHPNATPGLQTGIYWQINGLQSNRTSTAAADYNIDLTLPFATADATDKVCRYTGVGIVWDCAASSFVANTSVTRNDISQLSDWAVGNDVGPTAVTLQTFTATRATIPIIIVISLVVMAVASVGVVLRRNR